MRADERPVAARGQACVPRRPERSAVGYRRRRLGPVALAATLMVGGCGYLSSGEKIAAGALVGGAIIGSQLPSSDIEQVYYLGVFDPQDQLPPTLYRVRVR